MFGNLYSVTSLGVEYRYSCAFDNFSTYLDEIVDAALPVLPVLGSQRTLAITFGKT